MNICEKCVRRTECEQDGYLCDVPVIEYIPHPHPQEKFEEENRP